MRLRDRQRGVQALYLGLSLMVVGCARPHPVISLVHMQESPSAAQLGAVARQMWVSATAEPGGDGTYARPFRTWPASLPEHVELHLMQGRYQGPLLLPPHSTLTGHGSVIIEGMAGQTVVTMESGGIHFIEIEGGAVSLRVTGRVTAHHLRIRGGPGSDGVVIAPQGQFYLEHGNIAGPLRRAFSTQQGRLVLEHVEGHGPHTLVHAIDADSQLDHVKAEGGAGAAFFFAGGTVGINDADIAGHEYALQLARDADAEVVQFHAREAKQACISVVAARLKLHDASLDTCGPGGALTLLNSESTVERVDVRQANEMAVFIRQGHALLRHVSVAGVSTDGEALGDAFHVREARVESEDLVARDTAGSGLFATAGAEVSGNSFHVVRARQSALFVEREAKVSLDALVVEEGVGPAVVIPSQAKVELGRLRANQVREPALIAACDTGARLTVRHWETKTALPKSACIEVEK